MNYLQAINYGSEILKLNNIETYNLDSELLLAKALNSTRENLLINLNKKIYPNKFYIFKRLITRRKKQEPLAHIFQVKEFWNLNFIVNKDVLTPRPETELIVDEVLNLISPASSKNILDIGTGSGCIIISIINERQNCNATAIDISKKAIKIALCNAKMHHMQNKINFINIDIDKFYLNHYDFIVSNPPYISNIEFNKLGNNIRLFEPHLSLRAGVDGLRDIKKLISKSKKLLKIKGKLIFEIGVNQLQNVKKILMKDGFYINKICKDIRNIPRVIISTKL
tara:strand:- start:1784 stop:2626 length:843 start_codon:yes stop_codon:yes gene_type:complete